MVLGIGTFQEYKYFGHIKMSIIKGVENMDKEILLKLKGNDLLNVCQVNRSVRKVCQTDRDVSKKVMYFQDIKKQLYDFLRDNIILASNISKADKKMETLRSQLIHILVEKILAKFDQIDLKLTSDEQVDRTDQLLMDILPTHFNFFEEARDLFIDVSDFFYEIYLKWTEQSKPSEI